MQSASEYNEPLIALYLSKRQALISDPASNLPEMSRIIRKTVTEAEKILENENFDLALSAMKELEIYGALEEIPSIDVQMLMSFVYLKKSDNGKCDIHSKRANAMRELLMNRIGAGTDADPIQCIMGNEATEWVRMQMCSVIDSKPVSAYGRKLQATTYSGMATGNQPRVVFFEIDARYMAQLQQNNAHVQLFAPLPLSNPSMVELFEKAKRKRERFLDDKSFKYGQLVQFIRNRTDRANELLAMGRSPGDALMALRQISTMKAIEDIPTPSLLTFYSSLIGQTGDVVKQTELRALAFGVYQAIAHSGDGLTLETAVPVLFTEEEYAWVKDKQMEVQTQRLLENNDGKRYDILTVRDGAGKERQYHFDITKLFPRTNE